MTWWMILIVAAVVAWWSWFWVCVERLQRAEAQAEDELRRRFEDDRRYREIGGVVHDRTLPERVVWDRRPRR